MRSRSIAYILMTLAAALFAWNAFSFDFYQDDAYITYRYIDNYRAGHGLVFNEGERVEGYTNFGWLVYLLLYAVLGLDYVLASKVTGLLLGILLIWLTYRIAETSFGRESPLVLLAPVLLVALCPSLAYWAQAGLETVAFAVMAAVSLLLFIRRSWLLIAALTGSILIRPEGALLACLFVLIEGVIQRRTPRFSLTAAGVAFVASLPFIGFKLIYYGSILPNSFYAKTGFDFQQVIAGIEYAGRFFGHYPVLAAGLLVGGLLWKRMTVVTKEVWLFAVTYCGYVVLIGGDVLKVHRFFLPVLPALALAAGFALKTLTSRMSVAPRAVIIVTILVGLSVVTVLLPRDFIADYQLREKALVDRMTFLAERLRESDDSAFSVAISTIGAFSYYLPGHRVIDMLGLTDSTIARHPQPEIEGIESTWRERGYNSPYLLASAPDYISFSTGLKPSAPAERALLLYQQFQDCYRTVTWQYRPPQRLGSPVVLPIFKKRRPPVAPFEIDYPAAFVNSFNEGINNLSGGKFQVADREFRKALELAGDRPYLYLLYMMSSNLKALRQDDLANRIKNEVVARDSTMLEPQVDLYLFEFAAGNREKAAIHRHWLTELSPWRIPEYDSIARLQAARRANQTREQGE